MGPRNIQSLRENIKKELHGLYYPREINAILEILLMHRLGMKRHEIGLRREDLLEAKDREWFGEALHRLRDHCPVQYITGCTEFLGLPLKIRPGILIPRPETEELANWLIRENRLEAPLIADIGSGSGCVALALKSRIEGSRVLGLDISSEAIALSRENAEMLGLQVEFHEYDLRSGEKGWNFKGPTFKVPTFDIIVSNPPYIPESEKGGMDRNVSEYEPHEALFVPSDDPLVSYRLIAGFANKHLKEGGCIYVEIHETFADETSDLFLNQGFGDIEVRRDINGKHRMIKCRRP
jgi:release factor glutamine methyltransferase